MRCPGCEKFLFLRKSSKEKTTSCPHCKLQISPAKLSRLILIGNGISSLGMFLVVIFNIKLFKTNIPSFWNIIFTLITLLGLVISIYAIKRGDLNYKKVE